MECLFEVVKCLPEPAIGRYLDADEATEETAQRNGCSVLGQRDNGSHSWSGVWSK